jgi:DNA-binding MarR family transcriptional regulator
MVDRAPAGYELIVLLGLGFGATIDELHRHLAASGFGDVRPAHGFAFVRLAPDGATVNELAEHLGVSKQAASQMVDQMERHGYVARQPDPRDGLARIIVLTQRGWACIRSTEAILAGIERRLAERIGRERVVALREDLRRVIEELGEGESVRTLRPVW